MADKDKNKGITRKEKIRQTLTHEIFIVIAAVIVISLVIGGIAYYNVNAGRVYTDKASVVVPIISLKPSVPGQLDNVLVKVGDSVLSNAVVAHVSEDAIQTKTSGIVTYVNNVPGQYVTGQDTIVKMYNPNDMRVVGQVQEDKGLSEIKAGDKVMFTVDAFGSKEYEGTVEAVSPTAHSSDVVFSISDKREEQYFDVIVKFDSAKYPELKNGMSARMWIYI